MKKIKKSNSKEDLVYFLYNKYTGLVKIGHTVVLESRKTNLSNQNGVDLILLHTMSNDNNLENRLHRVFNKYKVKTEWFKHQGLVKLFIEYAKSNFHKTISSENIKYLYMLQYIYPNHIDLEIKFDSLKTQHKKSYASYFQAIKDLRKNYTDLPNKWINSFPSDSQILHFNKVVFNFYTFITNPKFEQKVTKKQYQLHYNKKFIFEDSYLFGAPNFF